MNATLNGKWSYLSFRHAPIVLKNGQVDGDPELAEPWSTRGALEVTTGETGEVAGTLSFAPGIALKVSGRIIPATDKVPASIEMTGEGLTSVNKRKGFFIPGSDHVVGTIMCVANDLAKQPNGTVGPFVLFPINAQPATAMNTAKQ
jgi:hypothetical protein